MIDGLVRILVFQGIGEITARFFLPLVPGPVIGLLLLAMGLHGIIGAIVIPWAISALR